MLSDYDDYDALGLAELVRTGQMTPLELVEEAIRHIEVAHFAACPFWSRIWAPW